LRDRLDMGMYERQQDIRTLAALEAVRALREGPARLRQHLERRQAGHPEFSWIGYTDSRGRVVAATGGLLEGVDVSQRPWWSNALKGEYVGDVHEALLLQKLLAPEAKEPLRFVDIAMPVMENGALVGVLGAHLGWDWARGLAKRVLDVAAAADAIELLIVNGDGKVLMGPAGLEGQVLAAPIAGTARPEGYGEHVWADGRTYASAGSTTHGERSYSGLGWQVIARQPREAAFATTDELLRVLVISAVAGVIILSPLGYLIAGRLAGPLERWAAVADRIGAGDREVRFPEVPDSSELGRLSVALRSMATQLNAKEDALQARIDERTAALVEAMGALDAERERLAFALDGSRLAMWELDTERGIVTLSPEWARMMGEPGGETQVTAVELYECVPEADRAVIGEAVMRLLKGEIEHYDVDHRVRRRDGSEFWIRSRGRVTRRSADGNATRVTGTNADITPRKEAERSLRDQALTDTLTALPNRRLLFDRMAMAVARARRAREEFALLFLDLDGFKPVNDMLGHDAGDELLRRVGERLAAGVRGSDTVARMGGDEFAVLLEPLRSPADAEAVAMKLLAALQEPFALSAGEARISASVGIALFPRDGEDVAAMLRAADAAMYRAKAAGKARFSRVTGTS
jgi:diguanylate cyclase (GGDEF)-like protein/PAS domain S-box-containing protein